jgi:hypothetical protein
MVMTPTHSREARTYFCPDVASAAKLLAALGMETTGDYLDTSLLLLPSCVVVRVVEADQGDVA